MGYSPRHLERLLREKAGGTFSDVLQKIRMEKAEVYPVCCHIRIGFCPPGK